MRETLHPAGMIRSLILSARFTIGLCQGLLLLACACVAAGVLMIVTGWWLV